jgi:acyl-CoA synthetase (NDP forming)
VAETPDEAVRMAEEIGYPVVMKIASPDILHKSDIGGIKLNIGSASEVRDAFDLLIYRAKRFMPDATIWGCQIQQMVKGGREIIIGVNRDPQFGPLIMFGLGGIYVEALKTSPSGWPRSTGAMPPRCSMKFGHTSCCEVSVARSRRTALRSWIPCCASRSL